MANIAEILRKAEYIQNECKHVVEDDTITEYRMGYICYYNRDFDGAEYWWEKAARQHDLKSKKALLRLYDHELKYKYSYSKGPIPVAAVRRTCGGNAPSYRWEGITIY